MVEGEVVGAARKGVETVRPAAVERLAERLVRATVVGKERMGDSLEVQGFLNRPHPAAVVDRNSQEPVPGVDLGMAMFAASLGPRAHHMV